MPNNTFSDEHEELHIPKYRNPLSAKIIAGLAIFWLIVGVLCLLLGIYGAISINSRTASISRYSTNIFLKQYFLLFFAIAAGCIITSAIFFVIYNITCDIHRSEYNLRVLTYNTQNNHDQTIKALQYVDDSIIRQSGVIIRQISNGKRTMDNSRPQREANAHDGAF